MSEAQKLMAEVLGEHRIAYLDQFICTGCKESFGNVGEATARQSAEIDKALGGLTAETNHFVEYSTEYVLGREVSNYVGPRCQFRWVSGYTEVPHG